MLRFKEFILNEAKYQQPKVKVFDVMKTEPVERKRAYDTESGELEYRGIKEDLLTHVHKVYIRLLRTFLDKFDIPPDVRKQVESDIIIPLSEISDIRSEEYARQIASLYSIFKKYVEIKKSIRKKIEREEQQKFPLGTIKNLISQGKNLGEVAEYFGVPKSTMSYKIADIHQTTFSKLKRDMGK